MFSSKNNFTFRRRGKTDLDLGTLMHVPEYIQMKTHRYIYAHT